MEKNQTDELELKRLELELKIKEAELEQTKSENKTSFVTPIFVTITVAFIGMFAQITATYLNNRTQVELEKTEFETSLVLKAVESGSTEAGKMLHFLVEIGLLKDETGKIDSIAEAGMVPTINKTAHKEYLDLGIQEARKANYKEAIEYYDMAIKNNPTYTRNYTLKGYALYALGRYQEAITELEACLVLDQDFVWAYYNLALVYGKLGKSERVVQSIKEVLRLKPSLKSYIINDGEMNKNRQIPELQELFKEY